MSLLQLDTSSREALRAAGASMSPHEIDHSLTSHELLTLESLADLAARLPESSVEHNVGDLPDVVADGNAPRLDMPIRDLIMTIPDNGAWAVIKNIEQDPRYSALLDECLDEIESLVTGEDLSTSREGFVFLSSPGSVTPTHIDPEYNVLLQVQGEKTMTTGTWRSREDRQVEAERLRAGGHRNLDAPLATRTDHPLSPGRGVFVPPYTPHIVKNGPAPSISLSVTWNTQRLTDEALLHRINSYMRRTGMQPKEPGSRTGVDRLKLGSFRMVQRAKRAVR